MAGLENLSEGEGSDTAGPSNAPVEVAEEGNISDDTESISSGASSEFQLAVDDGTKGKTAKSKGKGKAGPKGKPGAEQSDSAFEGEDGDDSSDDASLEGEDDDSVAGEDENMEDDDEIVELTPAMTTGRARHKVLGKPKIKGRARNPTAGPSTSGSGLPTYAMVSEAYSSSTNDPAFLPLAYRNVIQKSTEVLTKATSKRAPVMEKDYERFKRFGSEGMSFGPVTPFTTRLTASPRAQGVDVKWVWEDGDVETRKNARKAAGYAIESRAPLYQPWQMWAGEGYWKGMYQGQGQFWGAGKGKGKEEIGRTLEATQDGWVLREHVTLGLGGVGRFRSTELDLLSSE